jgi:hypothetical protein
MDTHIFFIGCWFCCLFLPIAKGCKSVTGL